MARQKLIWNITKICGWDCEFCCVDAYHISQKNQTLIIKSEGLKHIQKISRNKTINRFEDAKDALETQGKELSYEDKLRILNNIDIPVEIDFSGGDPLLLKDNFKVMERAKMIFGKKNVSITATGLGFSLVDVEEISNIAGSVDITYDFSDEQDVPYRPNNYNRANLKKAGQIRKHGTEVTAQIPLTKKNISVNIIRNIYMDLHEYNIDKISLMSLFKVGRGMHHSIEVPTVEEYQSAIETYKKLELQYGKPKVRLQSGLVEFIANKNHNYASSNINISHLGIVVASPWAYNEFGEPLRNYIIGDLKKDKLSTILQNKKRSKILHEPNTRRVALKKPYKYATS